MNEVNPEEKPMHQKDKVSIHMGTFPANKGAATRGHFDDNDLGEAVYTNEYTCTCTCTCVVTM